MTRLLVSVRNVAEAQAALRAGADLIDIKEPSAGSLGAAAPETWRSIADALPQHVPLSVALGELLSPESKSQAGDLQKLFRFNFAKVGLAGCGARDDWRDLWAAFKERLPASTKAVAVVYADWRRAQAPNPNEILQLAIDQDCAAILVDTYDKTAGTLIDHLSEIEIQTLVDMASRHELMTVLGGSITIELLSRVMPCQPDCIAVRGAVCRQSRDGQLDESLVRELSERVKSRDQILLH